MQQFFISSLKTLALSKEQEHQCTKVLRMRIGDKVRLVEPSGAGCIAEFISVKPIELSFVETLSFEEKKHTITLIASLIRSERLEWMIQKACECGVDRIVLMQADHGVVRGFGDRNDRKIERFNAIALEASEQSFRQFPVTVEGVIDKNDISNYLSDLNVFADIGPAPHLLNAVHPEMESVSLIIGPEGGFSESEVRYFNESNFQQVSLGKNVLRAETASIIGCALISAVEVVA